MKKTNRNKTYMILFIIVNVLIIALISYIVIDKNNSKTDNISNFSENSNKDENIKNKQSFDKDKADSILKNIFGSTYLEDNFYYYERFIMYNLDEYKTVAAIKKSKYLRLKFSCKELYGSHMDDIYLEYMLYTNGSPTLDVFKDDCDKDGLDSEFYSKEKFYPYMLVENNFKKLFKYGMPSEKTFTIYPGDIIYSYTKKKSGYYLFNDAGCDNGGCDDRYYHYITDITDSYKIGSKIYVDIVIGFETDMGLRLNDGTFAKVNKENKYIEIGEGINSENIPYKSVFIDKISVDNKYIDKFVRYRLELEQKGLKYKFVKAEKLN